VCVLRCDSLSEERWGGKGRRLRKIFRLAEVRRRVWPKAALGGDARVPGSLDGLALLLRTSVSATTVKGHKEASYLLVAR
jgi:hypothetical protein